MNRQQGTRSSLSIVGLLAGIACLTPLLAVSSRDPGAAFGIGLLLAPGIVGVVRGMSVPAGRMQRIGTTGRLSCVLGAILHTYCVVLAFILLIGSVLIAFVTCCGVVGVVGIPLSSGGAGGVITVLGLLAGAGGGAFVLSRISPMLTSASRNWAESMLGTKPRPQSRSPGDGGEG